MTQNLMWQQFSIKEKKELNKKGYIERYIEEYDSSYRITKNLIEDGKKAFNLKR